MDLHVSVQDGTTLYTRVLCLTVITLSLVSCQKCTTANLDPRNVSNYDSRRLVPLRGQETGARYPLSEQWIFPDLQFICHGLVTKWIFAGVPGRSTAPCTVEIETWRLDTTPGLINTVYNRVSTTEGNTVILLNGTIFTYEFASPVPVEPGDTVGVLLQYLCIESEDYDNVLSLNISGTGSNYLSYRQAGSESSFYLEPLYYATPEQHLIPFVEAVVEPYPGFTRSTAIETFSATERVMTGPEADQSESGGSLVTIIVAVIVGVTIGVITTAIMCVCVWCIIIYVSHNKEGQKSVANKQQQYNDQQQGQSTNVISMQHNEAYARPTVCHISMGNSEQQVELNRVSRARGERCMAVDAEETGDEYERMHAANDHVTFRPSARGLEKCSNFDNPGREYALPAQQQEGNMYTLSENNNRCYEYI